MIKPAVMPEPGDQLMLVVQVGKVQLALPPRLSKIVQLFNEGNNTKLNGACHVVNTHDDHMFEDLGNTDSNLSNTGSNHSNGNRDLVCLYTNGEVELNGTTRRISNGYGTPSPDVSEDGYPVCTRERRDYRGLVKVHKSRRRLPELPTDPKMSIFNNIDKLGVLEAELDVKKLEVKIRRQRQKVAAEFRSLTPEQRHELVVESPYLQKQIQRAIRSRAVHRQTSTSGAEEETTSTIEPDHLTSSSTPVTSSATSMTSSISSSASTITCSTPKHTPPDPPDIYLDSTIDFDDSLDIVTSRDMMTSRDALCTAESPLPLPQTFEDELLSICSSAPDHQYTTPTTTPSLETPFTTTPSLETVVAVTDLSQITELSLSSPPISDDVFDLPPPPPDSSQTLEPHDAPLPVPEIESLLSLCNEELPPYSEHDLTFVTPLADHVPAGDEHSSTHNSYSTEALEISHTPTHDVPRKVLSDSEVNMINVHTPVSNIDNKIARHGVRRSELCTPVHSLSASDSQIHRREMPGQIECYERAQSVPYGIECKSILSDVENILSKKFNQSKNYSSKSISDKLEEIQSKLSPRSFLNTTCSQDVSSYTLSYEDDLGEIGGLAEENNLYDDVITHDDVTIETDGDSKIAVQLNFDSDDFVSHMNARNEKENILRNLVSLDTSRDTDTPRDKSRDITIETEQKVKDNNLKELEDERTAEEVVERLSGMVLNNIIKSYSDTFTLPPPPYVSSTTVEMRVAHTMEEISSIAGQTVDYFITCVKCGKPIDLDRDNEPGEVPDYAAPVSYRAFYKLIACQTQELFVQASTHFNLLGSAGRPPPWIREQVKPPQPHWLLKHKRKRPHTLESLKPLICEEIVGLTATQFYSIEGILSQEVVQGDALWQDFNKDEVAMKFRLADVLLVNLLQDTVNSFKRVAHKQYTDRSQLFDVEKTNFPRPRFARQRTLSF